VTSLTRLYFRTLLLAGLVFALGSTSPASAKRSKKPQQPNIVVIMGDDIG